MLAVGNCFTAFAAVEGVTTLDLWRPEAWRHQITIVVMFVPALGLTPIDGDSCKGSVPPPRSGTMGSGLIGLPVDRPGRFQHLEVKGVKAFMHPQCKFLRLTRKGVRDRGVLRLVGVQQ